MKRPVLRILIIVLLASVLSAYPPVARAAEEAVAYLSVMDDLPLMPGLREVPGSALAFDSPQGRIVEGYARGDVERGKLLAFYTETLAQLGWNETEPGRFRRESEELAIEFTEPANGGGPGLTVRFALSPAKGAGQ